MNWISKIWIEEKGKNWRKKSKKDEINEEQKTSKGKNEENCSEYANPSAFLFCFWNSLWRLCSSTADKNLLLGQTVTALVLRHIKPYFVGNTWLLTAQILQWTETDIIWTFFFLLWRCDPTRVMASSFLMFLDHTQWRTTVGRTPLDEWSARRRDLYLTTHNTHNRQTSMPPVGFEPTISAGELPQTYALDSAATGIGIIQT